MRLFVAIDLPLSVKEALARVPHRLSGARWVPDDQLHLTLRFIGEGDAAEIGERLAAVHAPPFSLELCGAGTFPQAGRDPKVLWAGFERAPPLLALVDAIETALEPLGLPREPRAYHPHVTLARLKNAQRSQVEQAVAELKALPPQSFPVSDWRLYSSALTAKGATHHLERAFPLD